LRAVSVHPDVLVLTSRMWQTTCTAMRAGGESLLIDSPYFPDELEALPGLLAGAGFEPDGLLSTHMDFDHVLGRLAFPGLALGLGEPSVERLHREPGAAQRWLRDEDSRYYVERETPLALGQVQTLPVPGHLELGDQELDLHPAPGHTSDGMAIAAPWLGMLVCGDYLSAVEIPMLHESGSLEDYRRTLARLSPLVEAAEHVIPGHGPPHDSATALRLLDEDMEYLDALERGEEKPKLPEGRDTAEQRDIHARNLRRLAR
jgi:glyoxylase-like metal-dependent hydrolase (beta-lactamase superfamily II)